MRISKNPTIASMLYMTSELRKVTNGAVSIDTEVWAYYDSGQQRVQYSIWYGAIQKHKYFSDWHELVLSFKQEIQNATKHSRPNVG